MDGLVGMQLADGVCGVISTTGGAVHPYDAGGDPSGVEREIGAARWNFWYETYFSVLFRNSDEPLGSRSTFSLGRDQIPVSSPDLLLHLPITGTVAGSWRIFGMRSAERICP
jgi:hypothetical protein